ncbi:MULTISPECIES: hypothetical protein [Carboxydocella]|uniref:DUF4367 domain-containing protein n=2 Tax=Carboxydocella TaxID=178898 RepID=A0A1T4MYY4_9FIRM|nr:MULTISPECIES: hypothetical protein [Carboxydocella]AVX20275.1 hypothetical protein CFE_1080 [Carboxydocella thermautotrophica]AVX30698.1 hypothetical protein CTH_1101 [Carboxydocella thermautotrophica]GAW31104.1 hypothetical protein JDF658_08690 [Carboxydocella sp. JDF658]SJZ71975.1 hypothetical protein SAMN02745885_00765 [Carboxydocella sporoproducens DSM 16521]
MKKHWKILSIALALLAAIAIIWRLPGQSAESQQAELVPPQLAWLPRVKLVSGPPAIQQIAMMHGKPLQLAEGYIAIYQSGDSEIMLWLSVSNNEEEALKLFQQMDEKMPASQVFTGRQELKIKGQQVIRVEGMGQEHYYWVQGKYNYWVAANGVAGRQAVEELVEKK